MRRLVQLQIPRRSNVKLFRLVSYVAVAALTVLLTSTTLVREPALVADGRQRNLQLLLQRVVKPLQEGKQIRLGIIGGSISTLPGGYGEQTVQWLNRNYRPKVGHRNHTLINVSIGGSESGMASLCLNTLFGFLEGRTPPIDLLLVEYAYNDLWLLFSTSSEDGEDRVKLDSVSNHERIVRTALSWPIPVILMETAAFSGDWRSSSEVTNTFFMSKGAEQAKVARYYGVPIVNFAGLLHNMADSRFIPPLFADEGVHPNLAGHNLMATLLVEELKFHISMSRSLLNDSLNVRAPAVTGPSWPHLLGPFHGMDLDHFQQDYMRLAGDPKLAPLPPSVWIPSADDRHAWACKSSQIPNTERALRESAVVQKGFAWMVDVSDGGEHRSRSRPGFTTNLTDSHLVFQLDPMSQRVGLLFRKSWMPSGSALVWVDQSLDINDDDHHVQCPEISKEVSGWWTSLTTQSTLEEICPGGMDWSTSSPLYLHVVSGPELPGHQDSEGDATYFKSYGFVTSSA